MSDSAPSVGQRIARVALLALIFVVSISPLFFEMVRVEGGAMMPALASGTGFLLDQRAYGIHLPSVGRVIGGATPARGDVVLVTSPRDDVQMVKRVIGLAGDRVEVLGQSVRLNGTRITGAYLPCVDPRLGGERCATERNDGRRYDVAVRDTEDVDAQSIVVVPEGHVFVMGDHRDQSNDSRNPLIGPIPLERVLGRAVAVYRTTLDGFTWRRLD